MDDEAQPALEGLALPARRPSAKARNERQRTMATRLPIARVVVDVQAPHLGRAFDYLVEEKDSQAAQPGVRVRVRFGGKLLDGIVWERVESSTTQPSLLRYLERVLSPLVLLDAQMRQDIETVTALFGGTRANVIRLAVPPRVAKVEKELTAQAARSTGRAGQLGRAGRVGSLGAAPSASVTSSLNLVGAATADNQPQPGRAALAPDGLAGLSEAAARYLDFEDRRVEEEYAGAAGLVTVLTRPGWAQAVWDSLPGPDKWADDLAWALVRALQAGRPAVACLPTHRAVGLMAERLAQYGLRLAGQPAAEPVSELAPGQTAEGELKQVTEGELKQTIDASVPGLAASPVTDTATATAATPVAVPTAGPSAARSRLDPPRQVLVAMDSTQSPEERYRSYLSLCSGQAVCVIGTRAAMYAPVTGPALFAVVDDNAYQNTDGFAPYATVRDVLKARARNHQGVFLSVGWGRSPASQQEVDSLGSKVVELHAYPGVLAAARPWIRWLSPQELRSLGDATAGSRLPHTVTASLGKALKRGSGPVLVVVPYDGYTEVLACARCHRQARCRRCSGPLRARGRALPVCSWCARSADGWTCQHCGGEQLRPVRVGVQGTADEVRQFFRDVPLVISTPKQPRGVVPSVPNQPRLVIATPGAQPRVEGGAYQAVAIVDAWTSLYSQALDARPDTLAVWMSLASQVVPAAQGGEVLLVGQCDPDVAGSLVAWDPRVLARRENADRAEIGLPPSVTAASLWGDYPAVMDLLGEIGALDGDLASLGDMPSVMGPIEIPPAPTLRNQQLEGANDRVRAIVRVRPEQREELAGRLQRAVAGRAIRREPGEIRFWVNPKDLRER